MRNLKNMILESHGQLEQCIREMKRGKRKKLQNMKDKRKQVTDEFGIGDVAHGEED